jgi:hypothetical protein
MLQWLPRDAEQLAMESGCEGTANMGQEAEWQGGRVCLRPGARRDDPAAPVSD